MNRPANTTRFNIRKVIPISLIAISLAIGIIGCSAPDPTPTPIPTASPTTQPDPTDTPVPPTATPVPPTATPTPLPPTPSPTTQPSPTPAPQNTPTPQPEPTYTPVPSTATPVPPTATPTPEAVTLKLTVPSAESIGACALSPGFISSFNAIVAGDLSPANIAEVGKCYDTDALASDLERYFSSIGTGISPETAMCIREQVLDAEDPAAIIPFLYSEDAAIIIATSASINIALDILFCLTAEEREWAEQAEIFGLPVSPGMIDGMNCVADQLNDTATIAKYYVSVSKALSENTLDAEDALIFFDLLELSATCQFLPANFAPIAMQLTRDDVECMIEQVGTEPLLSFFNFAPKQEQETLNLAALAPLLGAVNACEISLDLTATN